MQGEVSPYQWLVEIGVQTGFACLGSEQFKTFVLLQSSLRRRMRFLFQLHYRPTLPSTQTCFPRLFAEGVSESASKKQCAWKSLLRSWFPGRTQSKTFGIRSCLKKHILKSHFSWIAHWLAGSRNHITCAVPEQLLGFHQCWKVKRYECKQIQW